MKSYEQKKQSLRQNLDKLLKDRRKPWKITETMLFLLAIKGKTKYGRDLEKLTSGSMKY